MFKRKASSDKVIGKIENFLFSETGCSTLTPDELYSFRYRLSGFKVNIPNQFLIKRIFLDDLSYCLDCASKIIYEKDGYYDKRVDEILHICNHLTERIILIENIDSVITKIFVYIPYEEDNMLHINGINYPNDNTRIDNDEFCFIYDLPYKIDKDFIAYCLQAGSIVELNKLDYEKEYFVFTNSQIYGTSTIIFHYFP